VEQNNASSNQIQSHHHQSCASCSQQEEATSTMGILSGLAEPEENEIPVVPECSEGDHLADPHNGHALMIKMDSSFTGAEGTCSLAIKEEGTQFVLKIPVDNVFSDPHDVALAKTLQRRPIGNNPMAT
jgi:hypothetical protein